MPRQSLDSESFYWPAFIFSCENAADLNTSGYKKLWDSVRSCHDWLQNSQVRCSWLPSVLQPQGVLGLGWYLTIPHEES